jgi:hypothetical protein
MAIVKTGGYSVANFKGGAIGEGPASSVHGLFINRLRGWGGAGAAKEKATSALPGSMVAEIAGCRYRRFKALSEASIPA